jgi:preflagellin peptidase FlaK
MLIIPLMIVMARAFNRFKILRGAADAKAMMCIAILVPQYPHIFGYPIISLGEMETIMRVSFPFVFEVLFYAGLVGLLNPMLFLSKNLFRKDFGFPEMFLGYRVSIEDVEKKHVWLMEVIRDGEHVLMVFPKNLDLQKELKELKNDGARKVWVQPKIPFIIFITIGFFLSYIIGNFLFVFLI